MGQTLPHGVYLPDNGERNCYTGLSQNWQKLDNLIGSHGDTVSFSQTLTEGVEIGKITINGVDVSLYHTDYSDKADADNVYTKAEADTLLNEKAKATDLTTHTSDNNIHVTTSDKAKWNGKQDALSSQQIQNIADVTNKANDSDVVHKSGDETIDGLKAFSNQNTLFGRDINLMSRVHYGKKSNPSGTTWQYLWFNGNTIDEGYNNAWYGGYIEHSMFPNGSSRCSWVLRNTNEDIMGIQLMQSADGSSSSLTPRFSNIDLGTSTNKWKTINGINPGALSLPNYSQGCVSVEITNNRDMTYTPIIDGYLLIEIVNGGVLNVIYHSSGQYISTLNTVGLDGGNISFGRLLLPVNKDIPMRLASTVDIIGIVLIPCQGNV